MGLYSPKSSKITKIHGIPLLHEGYFRKNPPKKKVKRGSTGKKCGSRLRKFATCEILQATKFFSTLQNFAVSHFLLFSAPFSSGF